MATIGQIYYNVQLNELRPDISSTPGITSATFWGPNWPAGENVTALDLIGTDRPIANNYINHLGIQGPPGLIFTIATSSNDDVGSHFMLGRTGVFELEDEIYMLKIEPVPKMKMDTDASNTAINDGINKMDESDNLKSTGLQNGFTSYPYTITCEPIGLSVDINAFSNLDRSLWTPADWQNYIQLTSACNAIYNYGVSLYTKGINGIYIPDGYQDVKNLIIDYSFG